MMTYNRTRTPTFQFCLWPSRWKIIFRWTPVVYSEKLEYPVLWLRNPEDSNKPSLRRPKDLFLDTNLILKDGTKDATSASDGVSRLEFPPSWTPTSKGLIGLILSFLLSRLRVVETLLGLFVTLFFHVERNFGLVIQSWLGTSIHLLPELSTRVTTSILSINWNDYHRKIGSSHLPWTPRKRE